MVKISKLVENEMFALKRSKNVHIKEEASKGKTIALNCSIFNDKSSIISTLYIICRKSK